MRTLRVALADFEGIPHGSSAARTTATIEARYSRDVTLADGRIIPAFIKRKPHGSQGYVEFDVLPSDSTEVAAQSRGFAVIVTATVTDTRGARATRSTTRTVKVPVGTGVVSLGTLEPAEGLPSQWVTVSDMQVDLAAQGAAVRAAASAAERAAAAAEAAAAASGGGGGGVSDHGALTGLDDDDHPQYLTQARGDARYSAPGHTHPATAVTDLTEAVQDIVGALIRAGSGTTVSYDDAAGTVTISATASGGGSTDPEIVRDVIGSAIVAGSGIQAVVDDAGDTITLSSTAVLPTRKVIAGTGLTGGGDLSADRTLAVSYGTTAGTAAAGNHTHTASGITDSTAVGRSVLTAADAAAARSAIGAQDAAAIGNPETDFVAVFEGALV